MSENENVETSSETSSDVAAEAQTSEAAAPAETASAETAATDVAAETSSETSDASRTGFAEKGLRAGDTCTCPDGRTGTVHQYDAGLICMPNQDQG
jgi:hypothetical protein